MKNHIERDQNPWQPGRLEVKYTEKAEPGIWIAPTPDVHERRTKSRAQERLAEQRCNRKECRRRIEQQPGKVSGTSRRLLKHPRIALDEEYVEEKVER